MLIECHPNFFTYKQVKPGEKRYRSLAQRDPRKKGHQELLWVCVS